MRLGCHRRVPLEFLSELPLPELWYVCPKQSEHRKGKYRYFTIKHRHCALYPDAHFSRVRTATPRERRRIRPPVSGKKMRPRGPKTLARGGNSSSAWFILRNGTPFIFIGRLSSIWLMYIYIYIYKYIYIYQWVRPKGVKMF
jgi:hypothetical protein